MHVRNGHQSRLTALGRVVLPGEWGKVMGQNCLGWEWGLAEGEHVLCSISFWVLIQGRLWLPIKLKALEGRRSSTNRRSLSHVQLFLTPWTAVCQAPLRMEFPGKNPGAGCHFLLQGIFLTQGSNPRLLHLLHWRAGLFTPEPPGKPIEEDTPDECKPKERHVSGFNVTWNKNSRWSFCNWHYVTKW